MDVLQKRWMEAQYYFLCAKIYNINNDIADVLNLLESIGTIYHYSISMSKFIAQQILTSMRYKPRKKETVLLARKLGVSTAKIMEVTGYSQRQLYRIYLEDVYEHIRFVPAFEDEHYKIMQDVIIAFEKLKELTL